MAQGMNFTYTVSTPSDGKKWGHITKNGSTSSGIVKDVLVSSPFKNDLHKNIIFQNNSE